MNDQVTDPEQGLLLDLPALAPPPTTIAATRDLNTPSAATPSALTTLETLFDLVPDVVPGVMLVDPRAIAVDPVNIRVGVAFDAAARGELIASMRRIGNTVPVRLRPDPTGSRGYLCPSGSQRLGAALHIQQDVADFRLRAIVAETMTDDEAFALGEADNAGRSGVSAMQQARHWQTALASVYGGNRQAFIAATGRSASIVSRTLALLSLPDHVLTCCADIEALTPYFAEQLVPRLNDPAEEPAIRRRAEALAATGRRLPGPALIRALQSDPVTPRPKSPVWQSSDERRAMMFTADGKGGGRLDVTGIQSLSTAERRSMLKALDTLIASLAS